MLIPTLTLSDVGFVPDAERRNLIGTADTLNFLLLVVAVPAVACTDNFPALSLGVVIVCPRSKTLPDFLMLTLAKPLIVKSPLPPPVPAALRVTTLVVFERSRLNPTS